HQRLSGAAAVSFIVPVADGKVDAAQAYWRTQGRSGLVLHPQGAGREHAFAVLSRPLTGQSASVSGVDVTGVSAPMAALNASRRTRAPAISPPFLLLRDRGLPPNRRQLSFFLAA